MKRILCYFVVVGIYVPTSQAGDLPWEINKELDPVKKELYQRDLAQASRARTCIALEKLNKTLDEAHKSADARYADARKSYHETKHKDKDDLERLRSEREGAKDQVERAKQAAGWVRSQLQSLLRAQTDLAQGTVHARYAQWKSARTSYKTGLLLLKGALREREKWGTPGNDKDFLTEFTAAIKEHNLALSAIWRDNTRLTMVTLAEFDSDYALIVKFLTHDGSVKQCPFAQDIAIAWARCEQDVGIPDTMLPKAERWAKEVGGWTPTDKAYADGFGSILRRSGTEP